MHILCSFVLIHSSGVFGALRHVCSVLRLPPNTRNFLGGFYKRTQEDERKWKEKPNIKKTSVGLNYHVLV